MTNERTIGGNLFTVSPMSALRSFALQPRLAPALAEVAGALGSLGDGAGDLNVAVLAPAVSRFFAKMPPAELLEITKQLLDGATMDGVQLFSAAGNPIEVQLRGRTLDMWRLLWFALEVNYPDFFVELRGSVAASRAASPSEA